IRPNCLAKVSHAWVAFHPRFRANRVAAAPSASQGPGVRRLARPEVELTSHRNMPGPRNRAEYFDRLASPATTPAASHQATAPGPAPLRRALNADHNDRAQNRAAGESGTARNPPAATRSVALYQIPARSAAALSPPARRARS